MIYDTLIIEACATAHALSIVGDMRETYKVELKASKGLISTEERPNLEITTVLLQDDQGTLVWRTSAPDQLAAFRFMASQLSVLPPGLHMDCIKGFGLLWEACMLLDDETRRPLDLLKRFKQRPDLFPQLAFLARELGRVHDALDGRTCDYEDAEYNCWDALQTRIAEQMHMLIHTINVGMEDLPDNKFSLGVRRAWGTLHSACAMVAQTLSVASGEGRAAEPYLAEAGRLWGDLADLFWALVTEERERTL